MWGYGVREDSTAGCYAGSNMFDALGLKGWTFDEDDAADLLRITNRRLREKYAAAAQSPQEIAPPTETSNG